MSDTSTKSMDDIVALCKRRGFIFQSSEIYGGINGFWDYGPLGVELKRNLKDAWWHDIIRCPPDGPDGSAISVVGLDSTIIMNPKVWEASGHVGGFNDPMVDCKACKARFRADQVYVLCFSAHPIEKLKVLTITQEIKEMGQAQLGPDATWLEMCALPEAKLLLQAQSEALRFDLIKSVVASSKEEAESLAELSNRERKALGNLSLQYVNTLEIAQSFAELTNQQSPCPQCGETGSLTSPRQFNLMFETHTGAIRSDDSKTYLRPETAQGIFANFGNVVDTSRVRVPFGIAQVGKAFRNEVTPRNYTFRSREFEQMEIEFFIHPSEAEQWYKYWRDSRFAWWQSVGLAGENLILREHDRDELAHYAKAGAGTCDVEYRFPFTAPGYGELEGVAHRTDFDLKQHAEHSGIGDKMRYFDQERNEHYFPHVIEPSAGADRGTLALLCEAYTPTPDRKGAKAIMSFAPRMAPIKAAVFPLVNKDGMPEIAENLYKQLRQKWNVQLDVKQNIGKRYARMDEAGTPFCFTIDGDTAESGTVTVRHRDSLEQERISLDKVEAFLAEKIG